MERRRMKDKRQAVAAGNIRIRSRRVGPWAVNAYALICPETAQSVLVDPGGDPDVLEEMLAETDPRAILITHAHPDHVGALAEMKARLGVPVLAHPDPGTGKTSAPADELLRHGRVLDLGRRRLEIFHTPGHTPDHVCIKPVDAALALTGDAVFEGGPGKTWSAEGFRSELRYLEEIVLAWPDDTVCHPGHGPAFRLGDKRRAIENFVTKDHGGFFGDAVWDQ